MKGEAGAERELRERLIDAINADPQVLTQPEMEDLLTGGYARALTLDAQCLKVERRITELAATADDSDAAHELQSLWLQHRTWGRQLRELRELLSQLKRATTRAAG